MSCYLPPFPSSHDRPESLIGPTYCLTMPQLMIEKDHSLDIPPRQKMEQQESIAREHSEEHKAALRRAVTLAVPHAFSPSQYGTFQDEEGRQSHSTGGDSSFGSSNRSKAKESWDELIERLFEKDDQGHMLLKKPLTDDSSM